MKPDAIGAEEFAAALAGAAAVLLERKEVLRELDAAIGDGDLGVTMELGCRAVKGALAAGGEREIGAILSQAGTAFVRAASSTFGVLAASAMRAAAKAAAGRTEIGPAELAALAEAAAEGLRKRGGAQPGDKTMLDAVLPAVEALRQAADSGAPLAAALDAAAGAAERGMRSTIAMRARFGRAAWLGERTIGVQDPGATAVYLFVKAFAEQIRSRPQARPADRAV